jgi:hypothetical protein
MTDSSKFFLRLLGACAVRRASTFILGAIGVIGASAAVPAGPRATPAARPAALGYGSTGIVARAADLVARLLFVAVPARACRNGGSLVLRKGRT